MFFINLSSYVIHVYMSKKFKMKIKKQRGTDWYYTGLSTWL